MGAVPIVASLWLVDVGMKVSKGDRLLEVLAGVATVDLPSPISGVLVETLVAEEDVLAVGQVLGMIAAEE
jgi:pyruvate/2-oxoglutarate dehydrogenase complex dihydrolipoamide acyltransferase (E2) component